MIDALKEAVSLSPDNIPLRISLAVLLKKEDRYTEASTEYKEVLRLSYGHFEAQIGLASCYYALNQFSAAIIIYEQLEQKLRSEDQLIYVRALVKENNMAKAAEIYQTVSVLNPFLAAPDLDEIFKLPAGEGRSIDDDLFDDDGEMLMEKPDINFNDVGGMESIKKEIANKIIHPIKNPEVYKAYGKKTGGGILLYGPPGCGKTFLAKATAGEISANFMNIGLTDILDMWIGNSEKNLHEVFENARYHAPCVLFIDEVDALGASRSDLKQSAMRHTINQFLAEMDGIDSNNEGVLILAATNAPWSVDSAFRRPGRFDRVLFVPPPDEKGRAQILETQLKNKPHGIIDYQKVAGVTAEFSGADLQALIERVIDQKIEDTLAGGSITDITTKDLLAAAKLQKPSTREWFATARNYALYGNESGQYSEILEYMNKKNK
jgi:ATP-dependent Zn protease